MIGQSCQYSPYAYRGPGRREGLGHGWPGNEKQNFTTKHNTLGSAGAKFPSTILSVVWFGKGNAAKLLKSTSKLLKSSLCYTINENSY